MASLLFLLIIILTPSTAAAATTTWCVARSDASITALQTGLDYACGTGGADCTPLQQNGLCFLPNTIQAHASYAFNSYYHRHSMAPASCDFSSSATVAQSDPSYGSCVYPSSLSTAGGSIPTTTTPSTTLTPTTTTPGFGNGVTPGLTPTIPDDTDDNSRSSRNFLFLSSSLSFVAFSTVLSLVLFY